MYVYGLGLIGQQGQYLTFNEDCRGSTVALTDKTGQVSERFQYSSYGLLFRGEASTSRSCCGKQFFIVFKNQKPIEFKKLSKRNRLVGKD
jgi:hypothetical protein